MKTTINGQAFECEPRHDETAIDVLRDRLGLTGTKMACGGGICGACTIRVDNVPKCSCLMPATQMEGADIRTIEEHGLDNLHPIQRAFMANEGLQCGFCTPGFINEGIAFYDRWRAANGQSEPSKHDIALAMGGHLCRCGAYMGIYTAIQKACAGEYDDRTDAPIHRIDAPEKVTGTAKYTVDVVFEGQLEGKILRSAYPHAIVTSIDKSAAEALEGVGAVVDLMKVGEKVRWVGQPVAGVAAVDAQTALQALKLIKVDYDILPAAVGTEAATKEDAPTIWEKDKRDQIPSAAEEIDFPYKWENNVGHIPAGLVISPLRGRAKRTIEKVREEAPDTLTEQVYINHQQVHAALEPHAAVAKWDGTSLHVVASSQSVYALRNEISHHFEIDIEQVSVEGKYIGGAFGAKGGLYREIIAAVTMALAATAPVRVANSRLEELAYAGTRTGSRGEVALAVKEDGSPNAMHFHSFGDAGVAAGAAPAATYWLMSPEGLRKDFSDNIIINNIPPTMPFRAPDGPAKRWVVESAIDEAAARNGINPVDIRRKWWPKHKIRNRLLDWVETIPQWQERKAEAGADKGRFKRGIGLAMSKWMFLYHPHTKVRVSSSPKGFIVSCGSQDVGNGTRTALAKAIEDTLGIDRHQATIEIGSSDLPIGPMSTGSQTTVSVYPTTVTACEMVMEHLVKESKTKLGLNDPQAVKGGIQHRDGFTPWDDVLAVATPFEYTDKRGAEPMLMGLRFPTMMKETNPSNGRRFSHGAVVTEVEVDTLLGKIKPINVWTSVGVGKIRVPELATSQMYGGTIQGLGYALYEQKTFDPNTGNVLS
ncbi:MAG: molybdopterin cofactor-binding domain-containing protein, partial [Bacteroidota bacterium]